jgi:hypothetical protein
MGFEQCSNTISAGFIATTWTASNCDLALSPLDALRLVDTLDDPAGSVVVAPYLGERTRDVLAGRGVSCIDTTGNVRLQMFEHRCSSVAAGLIVIRDPTTNHSRRCHRPLSCVSPTAPRGRRLSAGQARALCAIRSGA